MYKVFTFTFSKTETFTDILLYILQQKASSSSTYNSSKEIPEYSNHLGNAKKRDVYNHLNEKDDSVDDDTYDHASAAIEHERDSNDYSSVDDIEKKTAVSDNYFTLEKN